MAGIIMKLSSLDDQIGKAKKEETTNPEILRRPFPLPFNSILYLSFDCKIIGVCFNSDRYFKTPPDQLLMMTLLDLIDDDYLCKLKNMYDYLLDLPEKQERTLPLLLKVRNENGEGIFVQCCLQLYSENEKRGNLLKQVKQQESTKPSERHYVC